MLGTKIQGEPNTVVRTSKYVFLIHIGNIFTQLSFQSTLDLEIQRKKANLRKEKKHMNVMLY